MSEQMEDQPEKDALSFKPSRRKGRLFVLTGPSGAGKSTVLHRVLEKDASLALSVSCTTRPRRPKEVDGEDYFFLTDEAFSELLEKDAFLEWAFVHAHRYGTPKSELDRLFGMGKDIVFDIDQVGARAIKESHPEAVLIFILPPSLETLKARLSGRKTETQEQLALRLAHAKDEIRAASRFDYFVVNDVLEEAVTTLEAIFLAERHRALHNLHLQKALLEN